MHVSDLAHESSADPQYCYESTGTKEVAERIKLDGGNSYKGQLHYRAEFIPALNLKHVHFDAVKNEIQRTVHEAQRVRGNGNSGSSSSGSSGDEGEERFVTVTRPITEAATDDHHQTVSNESAPTSEGRDAKSDNEAPLTTAEDSVKEDIELSKEELLKHRE